MGIKILNPSFFVKLRNIYKKKTFRHKMATNNLHLEATNDTTKSCTHDKKPTYSPTYYQYKQSGMELTDYVKQAHLGNSPKFLLIQLEAWAVVQPPQTGKLLEGAEGSVIYVAVLQSWNQTPFQWSDLLKLEGSALGNHSNAPTCAHSEHADICAAHLLLQDQFTTD